MVTSAWVFEGAATATICGAAATVCCGIPAEATLAAPKALPSSAEVLKFVLNVPGAIGYVRASDVDATVKVIHVDGHLPSDKDYALHIETTRAER